MFIARKQITATVAITLALLTAQAFQPRDAYTISAAPSAVPAYTMPSTHMWDMTSDGGEIYRIFVSFPKTEMPDDGYPFSGNPVQAPVSDISCFYLAGKLKALR